MATLDANATLDLVAANAGSDTASVWLGAGNGTFGARSDYPTGQVPKQISVGDLNGDGSQDLVSANQEAGSVSVLIGDGTGAFGAKVDYPACSGTHETALGDFNDDDLLDVIAACWGGSVVSVLLGNGDGTLDPKLDFDSGAAPHSIVVGDFDSDGALDAAVANNGSADVSILRGQGDGTFFASVDYPVGVGPHSIRAGDVDADGRLDLVTANEGSDNVSLLRGLAGGAFAVATSYSTGSVPKGVAVADVSGDGLLDVLTANTAGSYPDCCQPGGDTISVLLGSGTGTFGAPTQVTVGQTPFALATGDLDGDGDRDVATANWDSNDVTVLLNTDTAVEPPLNVSPPRLRQQLTYPPTITVGNGAWTGSTPMTHSYQWLRCTTSDIASCAPIAAATAKTYVPAPADTGFRLRATVTATNSAGSASATSAPTEPVYRSARQGVGYPGHARGEVAEWLKAAPC